MALPVVDDLEPTLRRGISMARATAIATIGCCLALGVVLWPRGGIHGAQLGFEATLVLLLSTASVALARRHGSHGPLVTSVLGLLASLYWDSLAVLLGFQRAHQFGAATYALHARGVVVCVAAVALAARVVAAPPKQSAR